MVTLFNKLGDTPARFVSELNRRSHFMSQIFILMEMRDDVEGERKCEAAGRADAGLERLIPHARDA